MPWKCSCESCQQDVAATLGVFKAGFKTSAPARRTGRAHGVIEVGARLETSLLALGPGQVLGTTPVAAYTSILKKWHCFGYTGLMTHMNMESNAIDCLRFTAEGHREARLAFFVRDPKTLNNVYFRSVNPSAKSAPTMCSDFSFSVGAVGCGPCSFDLLRSWFSMLAISWRTWMFSSHHQANP